jgi:hypothetical protein
MSGEDHEIQSKDHNGDMPSNIKMPPQSSLLRGERKTLPALSVMKCQKEDWREDEAHQAVAHTTHEIDDNSEVWNGRGDKKQEEREKDSDCKGDSWPKGGRGRDGRGRSSGGRKYVREKE